MEVGGQLHTRAALFQDKEPSIRCVGWVDHRDELFALK